MADTRPLHAGSPIEGDGVSYKGIGWFLVILVVTVVFCQLLVWGMFRVLEHWQAASDTPRAPLAATVAEPSIDAGHLATGIEGGPPQPGLLVNEPEVLQAFRSQEDKELATYDWIDRAAGKVRLPIDRAKDLLLERGLPTRVQPAAAAAAGSGGR